MFAADILKVIYAPHKIFKQIIQNPKYWGPILILLIFIGAQSGWFFAQYSRMQYEETNPSITQLTAWTDNASIWTVTPAGSTISHNNVDIMNTTFYGNTSLQFSTSNSSSISMTLNDLNGSVNCGQNGFKDLFIQIKIVEPANSPSGATLQLFSQTTSSYFQADLSSTISNASAIWNNYTIPVGSGNWQSTGTPDWSKITGLKLTLTFPETTNTTVRVAGLFFRGVYQNPIDALGAGFFAANALFSSLFSFIVQWLAFSVVFFLVIKLMKGQVTWKPLFIAMAFALVVFVIQALLSIANTLTMPDQIRYPFEFAYAYSPTGIYPAQAVASFSAASQSIYNSIIAPALVTSAAITGIITIATYAWLAIVGSTVVRAITDFPWRKSILTSAAAVVLTYVILSLLSGLGII